MLKKIPDRSGSVDSLTSRELWSSSASCCWRRPGSAAKGSSAWGPGRPCSTGRVLCRRRRSPWWYRSRWSRRSRRSPGPRWCRRKGCWRRWTGWLRLHLKLFFRVHESLFCIFTAPKICNLLAHSFQKHRSDKMSLFYTASDLILWYYRNNLKLSTLVVQQCPHVLRHRDVELWRQVHQVDRSHHFLWVGVLDDAQRAGRHRHVALVPKDSSLHQACSIQGAEHNLLLPQSQVPSHAPALLWHARA